MRGRSESKWLNGVSVTQLGEPMRRLEVEIPFSEIYEAVKANHPHYTELDFQCSNLDDYHLLLLCKALQHNTHVTKLNLVRTQISAVSLAGLIGLLEKSNDTITDIAVTQTAFVDPAKYKRLNELTAANKLLVQIQSPKIDTSLFEMPENKLRM